VIVSGANEATEAKKTLADHWRRFRAALRNLPRAFRLVWQTSPWLTAALAVLTLLSAALPASQAWVAKLIVDAVVGALNTGTPASVAVGQVLPLVALEFALIGAGLLLHEGSMLAQHVLSTQLVHRVNVDLIEKALGLELQFFENPAFYDRLQNARNEAGFRSIQLVRTAFDLVQNLLTLLSFIVLLLGFSPLITLLLLVATLPAFVARVANSNEYYGFHMGQTPESRRMMYMENLLTTDYSAKEIKLFNLGAPLLERYRAIFRTFARGDTRLARTRTLASVGWGLFSTASYYVAYAWIIWRTLEGALTLGEMTLYLSICRQAQFTFQVIFFSVSEVYEGGLFLENLFIFLATEPLVPPTAQARRLPRPITQGITFEGVSFRYAGREEDALHDLNLHIAPGEKIALVGANGAGKTTFVKLLTRLYDPTVGRILLDGVDLRAYDLEDLRRRIGVIFQDFVHYYATLRENVGFGQIDLLEREDLVLSAAQRGGADTVAAELPQQYDTMLGNWFERGLQLSGGQWQKIALSRAFMRDGEVLVLDEPTAALDAEQEYAIFQRFRTLTAGKIVVLISHRFSTVRMADRIVVLDGGKLTEAGTHAELMAVAGTYARLFSLQAEGYR